jgi:undecaprenyl-diphosphatase
VLLVRSFGNGAGLLVQQRVAGRDLTDLHSERLDQGRLVDLWRQVAGLRAARIAHRDLGLASVMVDEDGQVWLPSAKTRWDACCRVRPLSAGPPA